MFPQPLKTPEDLALLSSEVNVHESLQYVMDAITLTRHKLEGKVPLIGFTGAPWTLMAYMIEGGGSKVRCRRRQVARWRGSVPARGAHDGACGVVDVRQGQDLALSISRGFALAVAAIDARVHRLSRGSSASRSAATQGVRLMGR